VEPEPHPVQLVVEDDLRRSRLTVFLRLLLAIPHFVWVVVWSIAVVVVALVNWVATLAAGAPPAGLHRFLSAYVRYVAHLNAYVLFLANPYPGFVGEEGTYPIDVRLPPPAPQRRWTTLLRIVLAIPAILVGSALGGGGNVRVPTRGRSGAYQSSTGGALASVVVFLGWFACLARGRMPKGLRDAGAYSVGYLAQTFSYLLLVTDRYPSSDPTALLASVERPPQHPVYLVGDAHDLRRSRVMVFFRLPLAIPHLVWLVLWTVVAILAAIVAWFGALFTGRTPDALHRFLSRYVRYSLHVNAFLYLAANPFPGFAGVRGSYPLDVELPDRQRQNRWITGFRVLLAIPAALVNAALGWCLIVCGVLTWFAALATGVAQWGLRNLSAYALRYQAQLNAYGYLLTDAYPHASPLEGAPPSQPDFDDES